MTLKARSGRLMGLDVGDVRVGVALSDPTGSIASPLETLHLRGRDRGIPEVAALAEEHRVEAVVVGMPLSLNGQMGPQAQKVKDFCSALASRLSVPVVTWDERLSTVSASRMLREAGGRRSRRRDFEDSAAAAVILQSYLDSRQQPSSPND